VGRLRPRAGAQRHGRHVQRDDVLTIEPVTGEDVDDLLPLVRAYCDFYGTSPSDEANERLARTLADDPREGFQLLARDVRGRAVGFARVFWSWSGTRACRIAVLNDLLVLEHARGSGVGRALITAAADRARDGGAAVLEWQTAPDNARAQRLYDALPGVTRSTWLTYELGLGS
jgi:GNAT superfamily N-acetyltransferase